MAVDYLKLKPAIADDEINEQEKETPQIDIPELDIPLLNFSEAERNYITNYALSQDDPQEAVYKASAAVLFSRRENYPVDYCFDNIETLSRIKFGEEYTPTQSGWKSITNSFKQGQLTLLAGEVGAEYANARHNGEDYSKLEAKMQAIYEQIASLEDTTPSGKVRQALKVVAQTVPYTMAGAAAQGAAGAAMQGITALIPGIADDVASFLVNSAVFVAGTASTAEMLWGSMYYDLVNQGIDEEVAWRLSRTSGVVEGLIESGLELLVGGVTKSSLGAMGVKGGSLLSNYWAKLYRDGSINALGLFITRVIANGIEEGSEEFLQSLSKRFFTNLAYTLSDMDVPTEYSFSTKTGRQNIFGEAFEEFAWGAVAGVIMGIPANVISSVKDKKTLVQSATNLKKLAEVAPTYDIFSKLADAQRDSISLFEGKDNDDLWEDTKQKIYNSNDATEARKTLTKDQNTMGDIEESETFDENGNPVKNPRFYNEEGNYDEGVGASGAVSVKKMPNGRYFSQDSKQTTAEGYSIRKFGNPEASERVNGKFQLYGQIEYSQDQDGITIQNIRFKKGVTEADITGMVNQFLQENPDVNVSWDASTDLELNVKKSIESSNNGSLSYKSGLDLDDHKAVVNQLDTWMGDLGKESPLNKYTKGVNQTADGETKTNVGSYDRAVKESLATVIQLLGKAEGKSGLQWLRDNVQEIRKGSDAELGNKEGDRKKHLAATKATLDETTNRLKAVIYYGQGANYSSFEHELHHVVMMQSNHREEFTNLFKKYKDDATFRDFIRKSWGTFSGTFGAVSDLDTFLNNLYKKDTWTAADWEFEASLFEAFRVHQEYQNKQLSSFFGKIASWMKQIYRSITRHADLNEDLKKFYDRLYGAEGKVYDSQDLTFEIGDALAYTSGDQSAEDVLQSFKDTEAALLADPANFDAQGRHLAPNGKPSNLTYKQWVTVRTPQFINWFGDWINDPQNASKIVDENGEPKVFYHGTDADFDVFNKSDSTMMVPNPKRDEEALDALLKERDELYYKGQKGRLTPEEQARKDEIFQLLNTDDRYRIWDYVPTGFFFAATTHTAGSYGKGAKILEVFLNVRNPKVVDVQGGTWNRTEHWGGDYYLNTREVLDDLVNGYNSKGEKYTDIYDGLSFKDMIDYGSYVGNYVPDDIVVALYANQIKSATDNSGSFSQTDNSILNQTNETSLQDQIDADYDAIYNQYKNTDQWMKAPNGKDTNLSERQWVQVRTPAFIRWFGDWINDPENASKVIDENGEPLVVYHGTLASFKTFRRGDIGFHFGTKEASKQRVYRISRDRRMDKGLIDSVADYTDEMFSEDFKAANVYEVFLNIKNPIVSQDAGNWNFISGNVEMALHDYLDLETIEQIEKASPRGKDQNKGIRDYLFAKGYDGVKYTNEYEDEGSDSFIAFYSNQVKSATNNSGAFSADNDSTLYQLKESGVDTEADYGLYVNNSTSEHFADEILDGRKTIETRTPGSLQNLIRLGVKVGDRLGIVSDGQLIGYVTLDEIKQYNSEEEFRADYDKHLVAPGSKYDWDASKGKVGLVFSNPERISPVAVAKDKSMTATSLKYSHAEIENILYQMVGEIGADNLSNDFLYADSMSNLALAQKLEKNGEDRERIYMATGWMKRKDGKWRMWVPDNMMEFQLPEIAPTGKIKTAWKLGEIYTNEDLYKAYPSLKDIDVSIRRNWWSSDYDPRENTIHLGVKLDLILGDRRRTFDSLMHEVQHIIQDREGFAQGTSSEGVVSSIISSLKYINNILDSTNIDTYKPMLITNMASLEALKAGLLSREDLYRRTLGEAEARQTASLAVAGAFSRSDVYRGDITGNQPLIGIPRRMADDVGGIHLKEQIVLFQSAPEVGTQEFNDWFSGSKAVDENGDPLVLYHGSPVRGITEFNSINKTNGGEGLIYATNDQATADRFSYEFTEGSSFLRNRLTGNKGQVYPVYMDMKNPLDLRNLSEKDKATITDVAKQTYRNIDAEGILNEYLEAGNHQGVKAMLWKMLENLSDYGYDGLIARMYSKYQTDESVNRKPNAIEYAVVDPGQVRQIVQNGNETAPEGSGDTLYQAVTNENEINEIEKDGTIKLVRMMQIIDGKIYSPINNTWFDDNGIAHMSDPFEIGTWYKSEEHPELAILNDKGSYDFQMHKVPGDRDAEGNYLTPIKAAYNPYMHGSVNWLNDQFKSVIRPNLVYVEIEMPKSDLNSGYRAQYAKDPVGPLTWKSGIVTSTISQYSGNPRTVFLSRYMKVDRVIPDSEVAPHIKEELNGLPMAIESVTPSLRSELEKIGVDFVPLQDYSAIYGTKSKPGIEKISRWGNPYPQLNQSIYEPSFDLSQDVVETPEIKDLRDAYVNINVSIEARHTEMSALGRWWTETKNVQRKYQDAYRNVFIKDGKNRLLELAGLPVDDYKSDILLGTYQGKTNINETETVPVEKNYRIGEDGRPYLNDEIFDKIVAAYKVKTILQRQEGTSLHIPLFGGNPVHENGLQILLGRQLTADEDNFLQNTIADEILSYADELETLGRNEDAERLRERGWQVSTIAIPGGVRIIDFNNGGRSGKNSKFAFPDHVEYGNFLKDRVLSKWDADFIGEPKGFTADSAYIDVADIWRAMDNGNGEWKSKLENHLSTTYERDLYSRGYSEFQQGLQDIDKVALQEAGINPKGWSLHDEFDDNNNPVQVNRRNYYPIPAPADSNVDVFATLDGMEYLSAEDIGKINFNPNEGKVTYDLDENLRLSTKVPASAFSTDENGKPVITPDIPTAHSAKSLYNAPFMPKSSRATPIVERAANNLQQDKKDGSEPGFWLKRKEGEPAFEYLNRVKDQLSKNLRAIYDRLKNSKFGQAIIRQGEMWYDTAHAIGKNLFRNHEGVTFNGYPLTENKVCAALAGYSPSRDWNLNVADAAITLDIVHYLQDAKPTAEMVEYARSAPAGIRMSDEDLASYANLTFKEMDINQQASFVSGVMEKYVAKHYRTIVPGEGVGEIVMTKGKTEAVYKVAGRNEILRVLSILGSPESPELYDILSQAQKLRNFYNNVAYPNSLRMETTIDSHAVQAETLRAIGSSAWIASQGTFSQDADAGTSFFAGISADAYRDFAAQIGTLPSRAQAIVWGPAMTLLDSSKKKLTKELYDIERKYSSTDEANGDLIREEILSRLDFNSLRPLTSTEESRNSSVYDKVLGDGSIWDGVDFDEETAKLRDVQKLAEESAALTDETIRRYYEGELVREPTITADNASNAFWLNQSSEISDDTIKEVVDSYIDNKSEATSDNLANLVALEMSHAIDYPQRNYDTVSTTDVLYGLRATARASADMADFMINAEENYGVEGQEFDLIDLQAIWDDVHGVQIENKDYGTLTEPNRDVDDRVAQFIDILSDKSSFEEFLKALQKSKLEGASLFINNLVSRLSGDNVLNSEGFRIAYGQVLENPDVYMDLYGQATDNEYWKASTEYGEIADELPDEFAPITAADINEVAATIENASVREAILGGTETTENGAVEKALDENKRTIDDLLAEKRKLEEQRKQIKRTEQDVYDAKTRERFKAGVKEAALRNRIETLEESAADLQHENEQSRKLLINAQRLLAERSREFAEEMKKTLGLSDEELAEQFPLTARALEGEADFETDEDFAKALENKNFLRDQISTVLQKYKQLLTAKKNVEVAEKVAAAKQSERYKAAIAQKKLRNRYEKINADLKRAYKERQALKKLKAMKKALARKIMRPVSNNVNWKQARQIMKIQAQIDPNFTTRMKVDGKMMSIEEIRWLFTENPDNPIFDSLSEEQIAKIMSQNLNDLTIEQLEILAMIVDNLRAEGLRERQAYLDAQARVAQSWRDRFIAELSKTGKLSDNPPMRDSQEEEDNKTSVKQRLKNVNYALINMARKAQILDGQKKGPFYELLIRKKREVFAAEARAVKKRTDPIDALMEKYKLDYSDFYKNYTINVDGWKTQTLSFSELLYFYLSANNEKNKQALSYGNLVTPEEKDGPNGIRARADAIGFDTDKDRRQWINGQIKALGDARYKQIYDQAKTIIESRPELQPVIKAIEADLNSESFERVREIMLKVFNQEVGKEEYYLPIRRKDLVGKSAEEMLYEDIMKTVPGSRSSRSVNKGMTEDRLVISPYQQTAIEADFIKAWSDSVFDQEHLVSTLEYSKLLNSLFGTSRKAKVLRSYIKQAYGDAMVKDIDTHLQEIANPNAGRDVPTQDQIIRYLRGGLYSAYLGFNPSSVVLQAITSPAAFLGKVNPLKLMKGYLAMMSNPVKMWEAICELSPFMESRSVDPTRQMIMDERKNAKMKAKTGNKAKDALITAREVSNKAFNDIGLRGLDLIDRFCVAGGWWAVYQDELSKLDGGDTKENQKIAARKADEFVYETQPLSDKTEISPFFKNKNEAVNLLTQFQTSLNVVWQNVTFDIPQQLGITGKNFKEKLQNGEFMRAIGMITGYAMSGLLLLLVTEGFDDDDDDKTKAKKIVYSFFNQPISSIPLVSNGVDYALKRMITGEKDGVYNTSNYPLFDKMIKIPYNVVEGDWEKAWKNTWQSLALANGLPYSAINELIRIKDVGLGSLLGRRK